MGLGDKERLVVVHHDSGAVEWRIQRPLLSTHDLPPLLALGGMVAWAVVMNWRWTWPQAVASGALVALLVQLLQGLLEVSCETLTFTPGQGVRFEARRRSRLNEQARMVPLSKVDCAIIHEHTTPMRKQRSYLAVALKPEGGRPAASHGSEEMVQAELAFVNTEPRLALVRQVLAELQPLLAGKEPKKKK
jgi:hypothetical protein